MRAASGTQHRLRSGGYEAGVASIGATLRVLRDAAGDLVVPFAADEERPAMRGALLAPWPNRLDGGRYVFDGVEYRLPVNEPGTGNASHGLASDLDFAVVEQSDDTVTLVAWIEARPGYPWRLRLDVRFELGPDGLTQTVTATNESDRAAPYGVAGHPYVLAGEPSPGALDSWTLDLPADEILHVSANRLLPTRLGGVEEEGGRADFRRPRPVGATRLNNAFTGLARDDRGWARARVTGGPGRGVEVAWDDSCRWVQLYTADDPSSTEGARHGLAIEPMTCPPDAFNSGLDLRVIEPGARVETAWTIRRIAG